MSRIDFHGSCKAIWNGIPPEKTYTIEANVVEVLSVLLDGLLEEDGLQRGSFLELVMAEDVLWAVSLSVSR
jgi:hypothetical protein